VSGPRSRAAGYRERPDDRCRQAHGWALSVSAGPLGSRHMSQVSVATVAMPANELRAPGAGKARNLGAGSDPSVKDVTANTGELAPREPGEPDDALGTRRATSPDGIPSRLPRGGTTYRGSRR
jgi:hypothetical protein